MRGLRIDPTPLGMERPLADRFIGFFVERLSDRRWAALIRQATNDNGPLQVARPNPHRIAQADQSSGLDPLFIDQYLAVLDGFLSERAGLEESRRPQPLIEPNADSRSLRLRAGETGLATSRHQRGSVE
jgi:hypothetical protein